MKKLLGVFLVLLALVCLLSVTANAQTNVTLSDDLQTLTLGDRTYSRADLSAMAVSFSNTIDHIQVSDDLQSQLKHTIVYTNDNKWVISLELYYLDGSRQEITFVYDEVKAELLRMCQDDDLVYGMTMWWEDTPSFTTPISRLKGTPIILDNPSIPYDDSYQVTHYYPELDCYIYRGMIIEYQGQFYYVDYLENNIYNPVYYHPYDYTGQLKAYEITDPELVAQIDKAIESQYSGETQIGQILSAIFLFFVFAIIPMGILIPAVIFAIRSKGYYRLTWSVTAGLCAAELSVFAVIVGCILLA